MTETETATTFTTEMVSRTACGTCKARWMLGRPMEHEGCKMRAVLAPAPDHPDYETLADLTAQQRTELPARFHIPVFVDSGSPAMWLCAVCGDGDSGAMWPCSTAATCGGEVFEK